MNTKYQAAACPAQANARAGPGPACAAQANARESPGPADARPLAWAWLAAAWYLVFILYMFECLLYLWIDFDIFAIICVSQTIKNYFVWPL